MWPSASAVTMASTALSITAFARASEAARSMPSRVARSNAAIRERPSRNSTIATTSVAVRPPRNGAHGYPYASGANAFVAMSSIVHRVPSMSSGSAIDNRGASVADAPVPAAVPSTAPSVPHRTDAIVPAPASPNISRARIAGSSVAPAHPTNRPWRCTGTTICIRIWR